MEQANVVMSKETAGEEEDSQQYGPMFHDSSGSSKPLMVKVVVNGKLLAMELDMGASASIVSEETFEQIQEGQTSLELQKSAVRLQTYTGESIGVVGSTPVQVEHNGQTASLVTQGKGRTLLGRDWMSALRFDWREIFKVKTTLTLQGVLEEHSEVFRDELGVTAKIHIDPEAQPIFHKARPVPSALRKKVEDELEHLQKLDIIQPIQLSDWAAPIVPVLKGDGRVRICGDFKVTVNRAARLDKYPIPTIDELFTSLAGGKVFSKLDFSHAYLQVELDEESRQYATINTHKGLPILVYIRDYPSGALQRPQYLKGSWKSSCRGFPGCVSTLMISW